VANDPFNVSGQHSAADPFGAGKSSKAKKKPRGGVVGVLERTGSDLVHAAVDAPAGIKYLATHDPRETIPMIAKATIEDFKHPLRHPGNTALDLVALLSMGAGTVARVGAVGRAAKAGESAGAVVRAATRAPRPGPRVLKAGGLETRGHYSRSTLSRGVQKATDKGLEKVAQRPTKVGLRAENVLHRRASKWDRRNERVADSVARAPGTMLQAIGKKLKPEELRALRLVAEETPVARRLGALEMRKARASGAEVARHDERIDVTKKAQAFLGDTNGRPSFKPEAVKLTRVYEALKTASSDRESMLKNLDLMDEASQQASKTKVARVAAGATLDKKTGELVGAADIQASPDAVFIGNPVERKRLSGKPKVSSTGTFGHTRKPSSLKASTGGSVAHALERGDVTNIVAEDEARSCW
jgi:hypothetical protein